MMYVQEIHRDNERFPNRQAVEAHMPFWAKEWNGASDFKGEEGNSQDNNGYLVQRVRWQKKCLDSGYIWKVEPTWLFVVIHLNLISHFLFSCNALCKCDNLREFPKHSIWNCLLMTCHFPSHPALFFPCSLIYQNDIIYGFVGLLIICPSK